MLLFTHIAIALTSVLFSTITFLNPSSLKLKANYLLIGSTLATGTVLIFQNPKNITQTCLTGLFYVCFVALEITLAHKKLAKQKV